MITLKTLYILRHAKAEVGTATQKDHERVLTSHGKEAARNLGNDLNQRAIVPDHVICSTAVRTRETWDEVAKAYPNVAPTDYTNNAYLASENELLNLIKTVPENIRNLLLVGHNPGVHQLVLKLAKCGEDKLLDTLALKFPTCTFAAIECGNIEWNTIAKVKGKLTFLTTSKIPDVEK